MPILISPPPMISQANIIAPKISGLTPACLMALRCVVKPSANIAMVSNTSSSMTMLCSKLAVIGTQVCSNTTNIKIKANHGTLTCCTRFINDSFLPFLLLAVVKANDKISKKGASIITRIILVTTAVFPTSVLTALPATTTCATS